MRRTTRSLLMAALFILPIATIPSTLAGQSSHPAFQGTWERTDYPVLNGDVARTWMWGPEAFTEVLTEEYAESPSGQRQVQYYDKARMEINDPDADPNSIWYVTNGLLVVELMTGRMQTGDANFVERSPADVNVAGDANDPIGPTYATFAALRGLAPLADGAQIIQRVDRAGNVTEDGSLTSQGVTAAYRVQVPGIDHQVASVFWEFMNSSGPVIEDGQLTNALLFENSFFATGLPVTEAYWADVLVGGTSRLVLMQCFERRCLTYTPGNPTGFEVEAGNVGLHYHSWRYPPGGHQTCVSFESLSLGATYNVGDSFSDGSSTVLLEEFEWGNGQTTSSGVATVENGGLAGGTGQEINVNNINLAFSFGGTVSGLTMRFGEYGGNLNIEINGDFRNFEDFSDIHGATIGGTTVSVSMTSTTGGQLGTLSITGNVTTFSIGGQELWIDDVCHGDATTPMGTCVSFESLSLGATYNVGDSFSDGSSTVLLEEFEWGNGQTTSSGVATVENGGLAGGTGQEINVNNINLAFSFGGTVSGLTMRFGEYGGNLNIEINGDFRNFEDFSDIHGATIGGTTVSVSMTSTTGGQLGTLSITGNVTTFSIGGQELWIDDVCHGDATTPMGIRHIVDVVDGVPVPDLAESWEFFPDGTGLLLFLEEGVILADGHSFTSEFVEDLLLENQDVVQPYVYDSMEVIDDLTLQMTFVAPIDLNDYLVKLSTIDINVSE